MQWTGDRNGGFSRADFAQLYLPPLMDPVYGFGAVNIEAQLRTPTSLLRWLHRFIALRKEHPVFGVGTYEPLRPENPRIFAHVSRYEDDVVLCVHNLARSAQAVELDLSEFEGWVPEEMLGRSAFPRIGTLPYLLARAAWVVLVAAAEGGMTTSAYLTEETLVEYIAAQRWYGSKGREVAHAAVVDCAELPGAVIALVEVRFPEGTHDTYQLVAGDRLDGLAEPRVARALVQRIRASTSQLSRDGGTIFFQVVEGSPRRRRARDRA
jgi:hypothetical protein